jgi:hypothetical protein
MEVELGSIKELNQEIKILKANIQESETEGVKYAKAEAELVRAWNQLLDHRNVIYYNAFGNAPKVLEDFNTKAKALGVDTSIISEVKELQNLIKEVKKYITLFDKVKRPLEQI